MSVDEEPCNTVGGLCVQDHNAAHASIRDPHLGAIDLPVVIMQTAVAAPYLGDVVKRYLDRTSHVVAWLIGIISVIVILVEHDSGRFVRGGPVVVGAVGPEFEPAGVDHASIRTPRF